MKFLLVITTLYKNKEWEIAGIENSPFGSEWLRFTAQTGAIEQLVRHFNHLQK